MIDENNNAVRDEYNSELVLEEEFGDGEDSCVTKVNKSGCVPCTWHSDEFSKLHPHIKATLRVGEGILVVIATGLCLKFLDQLREINNEAGRTTHILGGASIILAGLLATFGAIHAIGDCCAWLVARRRNAEPEEIETLYTDDTDIPEYGNLQGFSEKSGCCKKTGQLILRNLPLLLASVITGVIAATAITTLALRQDLFEDLITNSTNSTMGDVTIASGFFNAATVVALTISLALLPTLMCMANPKKVCKPVTSWCGNLCSNDKGEGAAGQSFEYHDGGLDNTSSSSSAVFDT